MSLKLFRTALFALLCVALVLPATAAEVMPAAPKGYFNDYAHVVSPSTAQQLNQQLEDFERATSSQIVVAIFPKLQTDSSLDDYCYRIFQDWKVGQKGKNNGAVLFVFIQDRKMRIQTGYGLEGALPDALCKQIIDNELKPRFRNGDFDGGLRAGVNAMILATRGEYKGTGRTVAEQQPGHQGSASDLLVTILVFGLFGLGVLLTLASALRPRGRWIGSSGGGWIGSGDWGGGRGFSGGFSGGGGSSGGGGASGSW